MNHLRPCEATIDAGHHVQIREWNAPMKSRFPLILMTLSICATVNVQANDTSRTVDSEAGIAFFESKVRPILVNHCYECHAERQGTSEGELTLDSREGLLRGGTRGPAVVPGDVSASWLLTSISHADPDLRMPPKRERLPDDVIEDLKRWVEMGAPDPRHGEAAHASQNGIQANLDFWAYRRPVAVPPPVVKDQTWGRRPLDAFIMKTLEQHKLNPSPDAAPHTLLRRVHFDLIGYQPTPEELTHFLSQIQSIGIEAALAAEVDRLIASPQFGERWGRHWLDVARFAESSGTEANISFPYAWRYRDYVIDSVNQDIPFDRFLTEQIAGDLLPYDSEEEHARLLIATGFLAVGPKNLDSTDPRQFQADLIDEQIDTLTRAILGSSVACARCHDHKFDPISMKDYYALAGIFASTKTFFGTAVSPSNRIGGDPLQLPELDGQVVLHASIPAERVAKLKEELAALKAEQAEIDAAVKDIASGKKPSREVTIQDALRIFWSSGRIEGELEKVSDTGKALPLTMGVQDAEKIVDSPLLERGDVGKPKEKVPRAVPAIFRSNTTISFPGDRSGRLELAHWLTRDDHPLTSRVQVNRIWHQLFGAGLVASVDNFGVTGEAPSHPELLDTLAVELIKNGWSLKACVREIILSRTYRQASEYRADAFQIDPDNRFLWRVSKRRLQAESIRDAMLAASGELDLKRPDGSLVGRVIGDKPIALIGIDKRLPRDLDGSTHRSVYLPVIRDRLPDVLDLFDFAEPSLVSGQRETTNVPTQALYLMNSSFIQERATALATRIHKRTADPSEQVKLAFLICFNREPDKDELSMSHEFFTRRSQTNVPVDDQVSSILIDFCQALLCTGEFRNLD
ncbi:PSD1 and planctomycete cytochrome C domain-containing protein [Planctomicrobium sp. SH527]|uniref:PSD1 and planctomycete cytochrome C domain-containing protein n=1 Tax=Planctomicrobium sp. SH527 TaxID=3448123 RepID=UPI003F5B82F0